MAPVLSATEASALRMFATAVKELLGSDLTRMRLFGSRARGEGHEHSDLDVAIIAKHMGRERRHAIYDLACDLGLAHGLELAPLVFEEHRFDELRARERRIALDIEREGIPL